MVTQEQYVKAVCDAVGINCQEVGVFNVRHNDFGLKSEASIEIQIALTPELMAQIARNLQG